MTQTRVKPWLWFALAAILLLVALPPLNGHALQRHYEGAIRAWKYVSEHGGPGDRYDCKDGRTRWICAIREQVKDKKDLWAVVVLSAAGGLITAFLCSHDYAKSMIENADNPWKIKHP